MSPPKLRFGWLDALVLAVVFGLIGYVVYRAQSHSHYNWDWRLIPGYFIRYDAEQGDWVLNLLGQGFLATVRLDRKSTRLNSSHTATSRMPSSA